MQSESIFTRKFIEKSIKPESRIECFKRISELLPWDKKPSIILDDSIKQIPKWFPDGEFNLSKLCLDNFLPKYKNHTAIFYECPLINEERKITFGELHERVEKCAGMLKNFGVKKGDVVLIYMTKTPEVAYTMLACCRIGAIHALVYAGYVADDVSVKIKELKPKLIISCSAGLLNEETIEEYVDLLNKAIKISEIGNLKNIIFWRKFGKTQKFKDINHFDFEEEIEKGERTQCTTIKTSDPFNIMFT